MQTTKWFGGVVVLAVALSLAMAGGAWAQSKERGAGSESGYSSEQGYQKGKKTSTPSKSESKGDLGVCTPQSCPGPKTSKSSTGRPAQPETSR